MIRRKLPVFLFLFIFFVAETHYNVDASSERTNNGRTKAEATKGQMNQSHEEEGPQSVGPALRCDSKRSLAILAAASQNTHVEAISANLYANSPCSSGLTSCSS